jgi:hypothetical protein
MYSKTFIRHVNEDENLQNIQGVSGGIVNILGGGSMDYSE